MTLRDLVNDFGANGFIRIDAGNGSAGPAWVDWDEEIGLEYGDTEMYISDVNDCAYLDGDGPDGTMMGVARQVVLDYSTDQLYASMWIEDDERNAPYSADNPYRYRIIF